MATRKSLSPRTVETLNHEDAKRKNIPTAEYRSVLEKANALNYVRFFDDHPVSPSKDVSSQIGPQRPSSGREQLSKQ